MKDEQFLLLPVLLLILGLLLGLCIAQAQRTKELWVRLDRIERWMKAPSGAVGR